MSNKDEPEGGGSPPHDRTHLPTKDQVKMKKRMKTELKAMVKNAFNLLTLVTHYLISTMQAKLMKKIDVIMAVCLALLLLANVEFYRAFHDAMPTSLQQSPRQPNAGDAPYPPSRRLDSPTPQVEGLLGRICDGGGREGGNANGAGPHPRDCVLLDAVPGPDDDVRGCQPFSEGRAFGLRWCAWDANSDTHISAAVLRGEVPGIERAPVGAFRAALVDRPRGIVIDAGAQIGMFSAAALAAGHYTISVDARPEHVQMNVASRALNGLNDTRGMVIHGALADRCGGYATLPNVVEERGNPGSTHVVGRVSGGYPRLVSREGFGRFHYVPVLTLDYIVDRALRDLPSDVEERVYALKIDIEGYEPRALMGAARLFSRMRPDVIVMELFAHRFKDCSTRELIDSLAQLNYDVSVSPRLNVQCSRCESMPYGSQKLNDFLDGMRGDAEMDLVFRQQQLQVENDKADEVQEG